MLIVVAIAGTIRWGRGGPGGVWKEYPQPTPGTPHNLSCSIDVLPDLLPGDDGKHCECEVNPACIQTKKKALADNFPHLAAVSRRAARAPWRLSHAREIVLPARPPPSPLSVLTRALAYLRIGCSLCPVHACNMPLPVPQSGEDGCRWEILQQHHQPRAAARVRPRR